MNALRTLVYVIVGLAVAYALVRFAVRGFLWWTSRYDE